MYNVLLKVLKESIHVCTYRFLLMLKLLIVSIIETDSERCGAQIWCEYSGLCAEKELKQSNSISVPFAVNNGAT